MCYGNLNLFLIDEAGVTPICAVSLPPEKDSVWAGRHLQPRIHVSLNERFAVVCHDHGCFGQVFDLQTASATMPLDRGDYHPETQPFSIAFFQQNGRPLLVHGADWNRLEMSDPQTGELLTPRDEMVYEDGTRPDHYLDFFHGSLLVSPDEAWIADDGWVWHPVGEVTVWNLNDWLESNAYESEDGVSRRLLCWRDYLWNIPVAWVDNKRLAIWGIGRDDDAMLSGARVFDVTTGKETATFAGPEKTAFFGGEGRLFSAQDDGLHLWDASTGERVGIIKGFQPRWQRGDFLIELNGNRVRSWNWRIAFD